MMRRIIPKKSEYKLLLSQEAAEAYNTPSITPHLARRDKALYRYIKQERSRRQAAEEKPHDSKRVRSSTTPAQAALRGGRGAQGRK